MVARRYTDDERAATLATLQRAGLAAAAREHGTPKSTIRQWATRAGVDLAAIATAQTAGTEAATAAQAALRRARTEAAVAAVLDTIQPKLALVATGALDAQLQVLAGETPGALKVEGMRGRDLVGMGTRALHDLRMLRGESTGGDQPAGGLVVVFATPSPSTAGRPAPVIVDVDPVQLEA